MDHGFEATGLTLPQRAGPQRAWRGADVEPRDCIVPPGAAERMHREPLAQRLRRPEHFELPRMRTIIARARTLLRDAYGVAVVDAPPLDDFDRDPAHYRNGFIDHDEDAKKRHVVRSRHRDRGRPGYDG